MALSLIAPMPSLLIQPVPSSLINAVTGKRVRKTGKGQEGGFLPLLALPSMMKILGKRVARARRGYKMIDHLDKNF